MKYVSDQRTMSELIDGEIKLKGKHLGYCIHLYSCRTKENENGISFTKAGHIPKLRPHEH